MIDLHTHTTASDGSLTFDELISEAERAGLRALAITDHDNIRSAAKITGREPLEAIPGVELSVFDKELGYMDIHVLGLFINPKHKALNSKLRALEQARTGQKKASVAKLRELGYDIRFEEVRAKAKGAVGRPHIARVLVEKYPEEFPSIEQAFAKLLGRGKPAYVERDVGFGLAEAVGLIHDAGGLSFLCHPFVYPYDSEKLAADFKRLGGDGVEVYYDYMTNSPECKIGGKENEKLIERYHELAGRLGMLESGGSDFHGPDKGHSLGKFPVPDELLERIKAVRRALHF